MILTTIALVAQASPAPDAKVAATAKAWFIALQHGKILDASQLDAQMTALLTPAILSSFEAQIGPLGDPTSFEQAKTGTKDGNTYFVYTLSFKTGDRLQFVIAFDPDGKIGGLRALPPQ